LTVCKDSSVIPVWCTGILGCRSAVVPILAVNASGHYLSVPSLLAPWLSWHPEVCKRRVSQ